MASGRSASCCADWITVVLDVLQVTGQVLLDVLALDFKAALRIVDRQNPEAIDAAALHSKPSQAVTPPPFFPFRPAGRELLALWKPRTNVAKDVVFAVTRQQRSRPRRYSMSAVNPAKARWRSDASTSCGADSRAGGHGRASRQCGGSWRSRTDGIFAAGAGPDTAGGSRGYPTCMPARACGDLQVGACRAQ